MKKRKLWISPDTNVHFRNIISLIKHLESIPIHKYTLKYTLKYNLNYNLGSKHNKTKKNITNY